MSFRLALLRKNLTGAWQLVFFGAVFAVGFGAPVSAHAAEPVRYAIALTWPIGHLDDIDIYVEDPSGQIVWYREPETDRMHLVRDDRGDLVEIRWDEEAGDFLRIVGDSSNVELVIIDEPIEGAYVVNAHHYVAMGNEPVSVSVMVMQVRPDVEVVFYGTDQLSRRGDVVTMVRFVITEEGHAVVDADFEPLRRP